MPSPTAAAPGAPTPLALSVLDLAPVVEGRTGADALRDALALAQTADRCGYRRFWLAEHHNSPAIASACPEVTAGCVLGATERVRVGAGGVMLLNHSALRVAEAFRTLAALYPDRVDLGVGRARGADLQAALGLRRMRQLLLAEDFPAQVRLLLGFLRDDFAEDEGFFGVRAVPAGGPDPSVWLLGTGDEMARMAAANGVRFAAAHHIGARTASASLRTYLDLVATEPVRPPDPDAPGAGTYGTDGLLSVGVVCARSDDEAEDLARSWDLYMVRVAAGRPEPLPGLDEARRHAWTETERRQRAANRAGLVVGSPATVRAGLEALQRASGATEVMLTTMVPDRDAKLESFRLVAEAFAGTPAHDAGLAVAAGRAG